MAINIKTYTLTPNADFLEEVRNSVINSAPMPSITLTINDGEEKVVTFSGDFWGTSTSAEYVSLIPAITAGNNPPETLVVTGLTLTRQKASPIPTTPISVSGYVISTPSTTEVIVPEQTVTSVEHSGGEQSYSFARVGDSLELSEGEYTLNLNGTDYACSYDSYVNALFYEYGEYSDRYIIASSQFISDQYGLTLQDGWYMQTESAGTYTVTLTKSVPSVEPKWVNGGALYLTDTSGTLNASYAEILSAISSNRPVYLLADNSGVTMVEPIFMYGYDAETGYMVGFWDLPNTTMVMYEAQTDSAPLELSGN